MDCAVLRQGLAVVQVVSRYPFKLVLAVSLAEPVHPAPINQRIDSAVALVVFEEVPDAVLGQAHQPQLEQLLHSECHGSVNVLVALALFGFLFFIFFQFHFLFNLFLVYVDNKFCFDAVFTVGFPDIVK